MGLCSVIIVAKDGDKSLLAVVESVLYQDGLGELIISDAGNKPDVMARLQQRALSDPRLKIVPFADNKKANIAQVYNFTARQAVFEYLVLLKANYLLAPDSLTSITKLFESQKNVLLSGGVVYDYDGSIKTFARSNPLNPRLVPYEIIGINKNSERKIFEEKIRYGNNFEVASIASACICVRAVDFKNLGGLDAEFQEHDEDMDISLRVQQIGGKVMCIPALRITALPQSGASGVSVAKIANEATNMVRYLGKFFAAKQVFGYLFLLNAAILFSAAIKIIFCGIYEFIIDSRKGYSDAKARKLLLLALGSVDVQESKKLDKKIVLVTGATSPIGIYVVRQLLASGAGVLAVSRAGEIPYYHKNLRWINGDLTSSQFDLKGYCVDIAVHCAPLWYLPPIMAMLKNYEAKRVIAFSGVAVFLNVLTRDEYHKELSAKLQNAENSIVEKSRELGLDYTIFRPTATYGSGLDSGINFLARIIRKYGVMFIYPPASGRRQPVHVEDLANAVVQVIDNTTTYNKSYNLSGGESLTLREIIERIFLLYKKNIRIFSSTMLPFVLNIVGKISGKKHINGGTAWEMNNDIVFFHDDATKDFGFNSCKFLTGGVKDIDGVE